MCSDNYQIESVCLMLGKARKETQRGPTHNLPSHKGLFLIGEKESQKATKLCMPKFAFLFGKRLPKNSEK